MNRTYIKELDIVSFGKFSNKLIKFDSDFNLIYGKNESGKSTIRDFIEGVLYGFDEGKKRIKFSYKKDKYKPKISYKYFGRILFSSKGIDYLVERNFENGEYKIFDISKNIEVHSKKESDLHFPGKFLLNLSYDAYKNLINNYQIQKINENEKNVLKEILMNSGYDTEFSSKQAIEILGKKLDEIGSNRAYTKPYYIINKRIEELEKKYNNILNIRNNYTKEIKILYDQRKTLTKQKSLLNDLKLKRDRFRSKVANENYKDEIITKNKLKVLKMKLYNYKDYENINEKYFDNLDNLINKVQIKDSSNEKFSYLIFIVFAVIIIFLAMYFKNKYILALLIFLYPIFQIVKSRKFNDIEIEISKELKYKSIKDINSYKKFKDEYYQYLSLELEKQKLEDILKVLDRQEKRKSNEDYQTEINIVEVEEKIKQIEETYFSLSDKNIKLEKKLSTIETILKDELTIKDSLNYYKNKLNEIEYEKESIKVAISLINDSKKDSKEKINIINKRINEIIVDISKGLYKEVLLDEKLNLTIIKYDGTRIGYDQLSTGFSDQLNFALKLSFRNNITKNNYIIFDDAFINYDEDRLENSLYYLLDLAPKNQVLYFTCHNREKALFDREEIFINKITLE